MQKHHRREVGQERVKRNAAARRERRDHTERRKCLEFIILLKYEVEVLLRGTDTQIVQDHITVLVRKLGRLVVRLLGLLDLRRVLGVHKVFGVVIGLLVAKVRDHVAKRLARRRGPRGTLRVKVGDLGPLLLDHLRRDGARRREGTATGALPAHSGDPATGHLKQTLGAFTLVATEVSDQRSHEVWLESIDHLLWPDRSRHRCAGVGSDRVGKNVVPLTLHGQRLRQTKDTRLGGRVVRLTKVTIESHSRRGVDDTTVLLLREDGPGSFAHLVRTTQVHIHHKVPVLLIRTGERLVTQNTGIVHNDMETTKGVYGVLHTLLTVFDAADAGSRTATGALNLVHHSQSCLLAHIVHDHISAEPSKELSVCTTKTGAGTRHQHSLILVVNLLVALGVGRGLLGTLEQVEVVGIRDALRILGAFVKVEDGVELLTHSLRCEGLVRAEYMAVRALAAEHSVKASTHFKHFTVHVLVLSGCKVCYNRDHKFGAEVLEHLWRHHRFRHLGSSDRRNRVGKNVVLLALNTKRFAESYQCKLGGRVVGLTKVAIQTRSRRCIDDTTEFLLAHVRPSSVCAGKRAVDVHGHHLVPLLVAHRFERLVTKNTCVVDENIHTAPLVNGLLNDLGALCIRVIVGDGLATSLGDLLHSKIGGLLAIRRSTQVIYEHFSATRRIEKSICLTEAATGTGDDDDTILKGNLSVLYSRKVSHSVGSEESRWMPNSHAPTWMVQRGFLFAGYLPAYRPITLRAACDMMRCPHGPCPAHKATRLGRPAFGHVVQNGSARALGGRTSSATGLVTIPVVSRV